MLKKIAFSLFGLALLLVCISPPQANAGVVVALGSVYPHPVYHYMRPYPYVAPPPFVAYGPNPYANGRYMFAPAGVTQATIGTNIGFQEDSNATNTSSVVHTGGGKTFSVT